MAITAETAETSFSAFKAVVERISEAVKVNKGRIRITFGGHMQLEMTEPPQVRGIPDNMFVQIAQEAFGLVTALLNFQTQDVLDRAKNDGEIALQLTERKIEVLKSSGLLDYIRRRYYFLVSFQGTIFERMTGVMRVTPLSLEDAPTVASAHYRMIFRDNFTGNEAEVISFEADAETLDLMATAFTQMRDQLRELERRVGNGEGANQSEGTPN